MRWPFMLKRVHEEEIDFLRSVWQELVDQEYDRATKDGQGKVHAWATEANYNVFNSSDSPKTSPAAYAAFQQAIHMFKPDHVDIKEESDAFVRS